MPPIVGKSVDSAVQHTNDDSVLSKRSAARQGYIVDDYLRHYIRKPARRTPLINRGYYIRIEGMTRLVKLCIDTFTTHLHKINAPQKTVQVLSLGAGFDTLAARSYCDAKYAHVSYFEVDFPDVMRNKTGLTKLAPPNSFPYLLTNEDGSTTYKGIDAENGIMQFHRYKCLGLDLRETPTKLIPLLQANGFDIDCPTVVYAECVMQYMTPECSTAMVKWVADALPQAYFMAYDQLNPKDSFGQKMTSTLQTKCSPLLGVDAFPHGEALTRRAEQCGLVMYQPHQLSNNPYHHSELLEDPHRVGVHFVNFYDLSQEIISGKEKERVDALEMFDEWEEWAEMCEHYGILCGRTPGNPCFIPTYGPLKSLSHRARQMHIIPGGDHHERGGRFGFTHDAWPQRRFHQEGFGMGVACETIPNPNAPSVVVGGEVPEVQPEPVLEWGGRGRGFGGRGRGGYAPAPLPECTDDFIIVTFGGVSTHKGSSRTNDISVHSLRTGDWNVVLVSEKVSSPCPRVFHSFTRLSEWIYVVYGGRTSPDCQLSDTYLLILTPTPSPSTQAGVPSIAAFWSKLSTSGGGDGSTSPSARFRHTTEALSSTTIAVIGGRESGSKRLNDVWVGEIDIGASTIAWKDVTPTNSPLPPLCSHASVVVAPGTNNVVVAGGMIDNGIATNQAWHLAFEKGDTWSVAIRTLGWTLGTHGRFSHTLTALDNGDTFLVLGGSGSVPKNQADGFPPLIISPSPFSPNESHTATMPDELRYTTYTQHRICQFKPTNGSPLSVFAVVGGGTMCFSFGQYNVKPVLLAVGGGSPCDILGLKRHGDEEEDKVVDGTDGGSEKEGVCADVSASTVTDQKQQSKSNKIKKLSFTQFHLQLHQPRKVQSSIPYTPDAWSKAVAEGVPTVFSGMPIGTCQQQWQDRSFVTEGATGSTTISVHSAPKSVHLDFINKNFQFKHVTLADMYNHCFPVVESSTPSPQTTNAPSKETWYFRSVGTNMKSEKSNIYKDFAGLCDNGVFTLPTEVSDVVLSPEHHHQSCLRINQRKMQLWTHYDVMDNILINVVGRKRVVLFPVSQHNNLYITGSSSPVLNIDSPNLSKYPRYLEAHQASIEVVLGPGDALVIPALWFHHITALDACISVNLFYKRASLCNNITSTTSSSSSASTTRGDLYDSKDLYGNKDLPCLVVIKEKLLQEVKKNLVDTSGDPSSGGGVVVPEEFRALAIRQLVAELEVAASGLEMKATVTKKGH